MDRTTTEWKLSLNVRATILAVMLLVVGLGVWEGLNQSPLMGGGAELSEYEQLLAGADESAGAL